MKAWTPFRQWVVDHPLQPVLVMMALAFTVLTTFIYWPTGPVGAVEGRVTNTYASISRYGSQTVTMVHFAAGGITILRLPIWGCQAGDAILLERLPHIWGPTYSASIRPCRRTN